MKCTHTQEEIVKIYDAAIEILGKTGMSLTHKKALDMLAGSGARVDTAKKRVYFPRDLVEKCLALAPSEFTCSGRTEEFDYKAGLSVDAKIRAASGAIGQKGICYSSTYLKAPAIRRALPFKSFQLYQCSAMV
jgi:trimethylamine:corrinoid methyltransferase-like protein